MHPLRQYLERQEMSCDEFGAQIGVAGNTVIRITAPQDKSYFRRATWTQMRRIAEATRGAVTPNDFIFPDGLPDFASKRSRRGSPGAASQEGAASGAR